VWRGEGKNERERDKKRVRVVVVAAAHALPPPSLFPLSLFLSLTSISWDRSGVAAMPNCMDAR
jgi:hypothetical protein